MARLCPVDACFRGSADMPPRSAKHPTAHDVETGPHALAGISLAAVQPNLSSQNEIVVVELGIASVTTVARPQHKGSNVDAEGFSAVSDLARKQDSLPSGTALATLWRSMTQTRPDRAVTHIA
jgi:hypothetical protein